MCTKFHRHLAELFGNRGVSGIEVDFTSKFDGMPHQGCDVLPNVNYTVRNDERCEGEVSAAGWSSLRALSSRAKLARRYLGGCLTHRQQNGRISSAVSCGVVVLLWNDQNKYRQIDNPKPITLYKSRRYSWGSLLSSISWSVVRRHTLYRKDQSMTTSISRVML